MAYEDESEMAREMIDEAGGWMTLTIPGAQVVDTATDTSTQTPDRVLHVKAVVADPPVPYGVTTEQGTQIRQNNRQLYLAGDGLPVSEIPPTAFFTFLGAKWNVKGSRPLAPNGRDQILFIVDVQR